LFTAFLTGFARQISSSLFIKQQMMHNKVQMNKSTGQQGRRPHLLLPNLTALQARSQPSDNRSFSSDFGSFSGFDKLEFPSVAGKPRILK